MLVRFTKTHPSGIPEGAIRDLKTGHAERLKGAGYAEDHVPDPETPLDADDVIPPTDVVEPVEDDVIPPVDLTKKTNVELEAMLTEKGIPFEAKTVKAKLIELLTNG